jgi:hypothetical protein
MPRLLSLQPSLVGKSNVNYEPTVIKVVIDRVGSMSGPQNARLSQAVGSRLNQSRRAVLRSHRTATQSAHLPEAAGGWAGLMRVPVIWKRRRVGKAKRAHQTPRIGGHGAQERTFAHPAIRSKSAFRCEVLGGNQRLRETPHGAELKAVALVLLPTGRSVRKGEVEPVLSFSRVVAVTGLVHPSFYRLWLLGTLRCSSLPWIGAFHFCWIGI